MTTILDIPFPVLAMIGRISGRDGYLQFSRTCKMLRRLTTDLIYAELARRFFTIDLPYTVILTYPHPYPLFKTEVTLVYCPHCKVYVEACDGDEFRTEEDVEYRAPHSCIPDELKGVLQCYCAHTIIDPYTIPQLIPLEDALKRFPANSEYIDVEGVKCWVVGVARIDKKEKDIDAPPPFDDEFSGNFYCECTGRTGQTFSIIYC